MSEMYRVGVALTLTDGVTSGLKSISKTLFGVGVAADASQAAISRLGMGIVGVVSAMAGVATLKGVADIVRAGGKVVDQQANMVALGMSHLQIAQATALAYKELSVHGATLAGNLKAYQEVRAVMANDAEASAALDPFLKASFVRQSRGEDDSALMYALKAMDIQGAFVTNGKLDPNRVAGALNGVNAIDALTQGLLTPQQLYQFTRLAGPAASMMGTNSYLRDNYEVMMGLGTTGGRGKSMAIKTLIGGQVSKALREHLYALGLVDPGGITSDHGQYSITAGKLHGTQDLLKNGLISWFYDTVIPAMKTKGFAETPAGLMSALGPMDQTTARLFSFLLTNRAQVEAGMTKYDDAVRVEQYDAASMAFTGAVNDLGNAMVSVWQALGAPAAQMVVPWLEGFADELNHLSQWVGAHPNIAKDIVVGLAAAGVALTAFGVVLTGAAILALVGTGGTLAAVAAGVVGMSAVLTAANWKGLTKDFEGAVTGFEHGLQRLVYDLVNPGQLLKDVSSAANPVLVPAPTGMHWQDFGRGGERLVLNGQPVPAPGISANDAVHQMATAFVAWYNQGAPVAVTNAPAIGKAAVVAVGKHVSRPTTSGVQGITRANPPPSAAYSNANAGY